MTIPRQWPWTANALHADYLGISKKRCARHNGDDAAPGCPLSDQHVTPDEFRGETTTRKRRNRMDMRSRR